MEKNMKYERGSRMIWWFVIWIHKYLYLCIAEDAVFLLPSRLSDVGSGPEVRIRVIRVSA